VGEGVYTISDPTKAGGVFVNANVAAAYMGFCGFLAWGCAGLFKNRWLMVVATLDLASIFFAGSKAGVGLCCLMLALLLVLHLIKKRRIGLGVAATICFAAATALLVLYFGAQAFLHSSYVDNSSETLGTRFVIWEFGLTVLKSSPLLGLGFGGWEKAWPAYALSHGSNPAFPPHNALLALFVQSGAGALVAGVLFVLLTLRFIWRSANTLDDSVRRYALGVLCGVSWLFLQAQGENFGLIGEVHLTQFMALALGYLVFLNGRESATYAQ
jgi:O-antigen ligase